MLHKAGLPVVVPAPERFAVHKLIVSTRRPGDGIGRAKAAKDLVQAASVIEALALAHRQGDLGLAWSEAWERGPSWRDALRDGLRALGTDRGASARTAVGTGLAELGLDPALYGAERVPGPSAQT